MKKLLAIPLAFACCTLAAQAPSLYEQSVARAVNERFASPDVSYLLVDARTGTTIAVRWPDIGRAVPPGSLLKPFAALAYAVGHGFKYPEFVCRGTSEGCWYPRGHGRIGITQAVEFSCNAYFRQLSRLVRQEDLHAALRQVGMEDAPALPAPSSLFGLGDAWRVPPERLARAYLDLVRQADSPGVAPLVRGMALSAQAGTASAIGKALDGRAALAKTGTAPCVHTPRAPGDGYVIALYPAESPRLLLLVRVHGVPGAEAAVTAGQILRVAADGT
jgi:cell division protein FtsI/penicillin-binding protein 2